MESFSSDENHMIRQAVSDITEGSSSCKDVEEITFKKRKGMYRKFRTFFENQEDIVAPPDEPKTSDFAVPQTMYRKANWPPSALGYVAPTLPIFNVQGEEFTETKHTIFWKKFWEMNDAFFPAVYGRNSSVIDYCTEPDDVAEDIEKLEKTKHTGFWKKIFEVDDASFPAISGRNSPVLASAKPDDVAEDIEKLEKEGAPGKKLEETQKQEKVVFKKYEEEEIGQHEEAVTDTKHTIFWKKFWEMNDAFFPAVYGRNSSVIDYAEPDDVAEDIEKLEKTNHTIFWKKFWEMNDAFFPAVYGRNSSVIDYAEPDDVAEDIEKLEKVNDRGDESDPNDAGDDYEVSGDEEDDEQTILEKEKMEVDVDHKKVIQELEAAKSEKSSEEEEEKDESDKTEEDSSSQSREI